LGILYLLKYSFEQLSSNSTILKSFNPYEILEVDESASDAEIRKAFRYISIMISFINKKKIENKLLNTIQIKIKMILKQQQNL